MAIDLRSRGVDWKAKRESIEATTTFLCCRRDGIGSTAGSK